MNQQKFPQQTDAEHTTPNAKVGLSLMAIQDLLGLFRNHQEHAERTSSTKTPDITLHDAMQDKPLTYV